MEARRVALVGLLLALGAAGGAAQDKRGAPIDRDQLTAWLERLRAEAPGEAAKVEQLAASDPAAAWAFLRARYGGAAPPGKTPSADKRPSQGTGALPARVESYREVETLAVGRFELVLCRRDDGAFGIGAVRHRGRPLRCTEFLWTFGRDGRVGSLARRDGRTLLLRDPDAQLTFTGESRNVAGTRFEGLRVRWVSDPGDVVETASFEPGGDAAGAWSFDGYRGWHDWPSLLRADAVPVTNPKLIPAGLQGAGFRCVQADATTVVAFSTHWGSAERVASRGRALEVVTAWPATPVVERFVFVAHGPGGAHPDGDTRINRWTRAAELAHAEQRRAWEVPARPTEAWLVWPPFSRAAFVATADLCLAATVRDGFTAIHIDTVWENLEAHGGKKNLNTWGYRVSEAYGGLAGLRAVVERCHAAGLKVVPWVPAGHLHRDAPTWREHPEWVARNADGTPWLDPSGLWHGDPATAFREHWQESVAEVIRDAGLDGLWIDTHLPFANRLAGQPGATALGEVYRAWLAAGARHLWVEGDAGALAGYGTLGFEAPPPNIERLELCWGAMAPMGSADPHLLARWYRRAIASGAQWAIGWDPMYAEKLAGPDWEAARAEVRRTVRDLGPVRQRMQHRFVHADGSGYTWTNDTDRARVIWLFADRPLPDGREGRAGQVYVVE